MRNFFSRFNIPLDLISLAIPGLTPKYVSCQTGEIINERNPPSATSAIEAYAAQLSRHHFLHLSLGNITPSVPTDLQLSFRDFVEK